MKDLKTLVLFASLFIAIGACKKKKDDEPKAIGGKGGSAVINATAKHHGKNIDSCTIYIKYNATNMPSSYDDSVKCVMSNGKPVASFSGLKTGDYYLYGRGWDTSIHQTVVGGIQYTITSETAQDITVPVTEGD